MTENVISEEFSTTFEEGNQTKVTNAKSLASKNIKSRGVKSLVARYSKQQKPILVTKATFQFIKSSDMKLCPNTFKHKHYQFLCVRKH